MKRSLLAALTLSPGLVLSAIVGVGLANAEPGPGVIADRCTNQVDYTGDPRSNAEINSIGADTGQCPAPQTGGAASGSGSASTGGAGGTFGATGADAAFLQYLQSTGTPVSNEKGAQLAISVGRDFCGALRSGATQPQAHQAMYGKYSDVSVQSIHSAAAAGNLIYCPELLG